MIRPLWSGLLSGTWSHGALHFFAWPMEVSSRFRSSSWQGFFQGAKQELQRTEHESSNLGASCPRGSDRPTQTSAHLNLKASGVAKLKRQSRHAL